MAPLVALLWGCGEAATVPETRHELGGAYAGPLTGTSEEGELEGRLELAIEASDGTLSGTYAISGTITYDGVSGRITGDGSFVGIFVPGSGARPSLALTLRNGMCPNHEGELGGWFDSVRGTVELGGGIDILGPDCAIFTTYQSWALLGR